MKGLGEVRRRRINRYYLNCIAIQTIQQVPVPVCCHATLLTKCRYVDIVARYKRVVVRRTNPQAIEFVGPNPTIRQMFYLRLCLCIAQIVCLLIPCLHVPRNSSCLSKITINSCLYVPSFGRIFLQPLTILCDNLVLCITWAPSS